MFPVVDSGIMPTLIAAASYFQSLKKHTRSHHVASPCLTRGAPSLSSLLQLFIQAGTSPECL